MRKRLPFTSDDGIVVLRSERNAATEAAGVSSALQERLGPDATAGLLELFEAGRQEWTADVTSAAVERFERRLSEEAANWRGRFAEEAANGRVALAQTEAALRLEIREGDASIRQEMLAGRFELLKWSFLFWVGQVFAVAGVVAVVLRLMRV